MSDAGSSKSSRPKQLSGLTESMSAMSLSDKGLKVSTPDTYNGTRHNLEDFLLQVRLCAHFNRSTLSSDPDKVTYAASLLRGTAARAFRPYLKDWLENRKDEASLNPETRKIFTDWDKFEAKLTELFGVANEERNADRQIRQLRQVTSVAMYASEFQRFVQELHWNDAAYRSQFYLGLKDTVKVELWKEGEHASLTTMVKSAKRIDERLQDLRQERYMYSGNFGRRPKATGKYSSGYDPMELDATMKKGESRQGIRCYRCQKQGHIARNCMKNRVRRELNSTKFSDTYQVYAKNC